MNGGHEKLRQALEDLQARLAELRTIDPAVAEHLATTIAEARTLLAKESPAAAEHQGVSESFGEALRNYEASHPTLAGNLRSVVDALAQIGI
jgi:hypothetical protein